MKTILTLLLPFLFCHCSQIQGDETAGTYKATFFMTDFDGYAQTSKRAVIKGQNQSRVPIAAIQAAATVAGLNIAAGTQEVLSNNSTKEVLGEQGVVSGIAAGKETTKQLKINTDGANEALKIITPKP